MLKEVVTPAVPAIPSEAEVAPADFHEFETWRNTGELPKAEEKPADVIPPAPPAKDGKTAEDPGASENEQEGERDEKGRFKLKPDAVPPGVQKRIDRERARRGEVERERDAERQKAADLERQLAELRQGKTAKADDDPELKMEDFDDAEAYWKAVGARETRLETKAQAKREADAKTHQEAKQEFDAATKRWAESEQEVRAAHDDFDEVMDAVSDIMLPPHALLEILHSDLQAELQYHLATHRPELEALAKVPPHRIGREVAKLEAKLGKSPAPDPAPKVSRAPAPPSLVNSRGQRTVDPTDPKTNFNDFEKSRNEELRKSGKRY